MELELQLAPPELHCELVLQGCSQIHAACAAPWVEAVIVQCASFPLFGTHASLGAFARGRELELQLELGQGDRGGLQACQGPQAPAPRSLQAVAAGTSLEVVVHGEVDDAADGLGAEVEVQDDEEDAAGDPGVDADLGVDEGDGLGVDEGDGLDEVADLGADCQCNVLASPHGLPEHEDGLGVDEAEGAGVGVSCSGDEGLDEGDGPGVDEVEGAAVGVNCLDGDDGPLRLDEEDGILDAGVVAE